MNFLVVTFWVLAIVIFLFGLVSNYGEAYLSPIALYLFRYGKANVSKVKMNAMKKLDVPKSWFTHFYLYSAIVQSCIFFIVLKTYLVDTPGAQIPESYYFPCYFLNLLYWIGGSDRSQTVDATTTALVTGMFLIQVCRRLCESAFVSVYSGTKMNLFHYLVAFVHYSGSMLSLVAHSPGFTGSSVASENELRISWEWDPETTFFRLAGIALFIYGSIQQHRVHVGFANLRKTDNAIVSYSHQIPRGGLFELVSCPNYWAEILIYTALATTTSFQNPSWNAVTIWVICNQIMAGVMNHIWYNRTFPDYPKDRRAVIPFLW